MLIIRDATEQDVDFLAALQAKEMLRENPEQDIEALRPLAIEDTRSHLCQPPDGSVLSVIERDGRSVGRLRVVRSDERIFLAGIQVTPSARNQGIGSTIIGGLLDEARTRNLPLQLRVHRANVDARRLYARIGFERYAEADGDFLMTSR